MKKYLGMSSAAVVTGTLRVKLSPATIRESLERLQHLQIIIISFHLYPYFCRYMTVFFSFHNNLKDLDPSYKMDLDLWDCFGKKKSFYSCITHLL